MKYIFSLLFWCFVLLVNGYGQNINQNDGNIVGFNRIITGNNSWMDIQLSGSSSSFKIHDNTNNSNWVRWDAGSSFTEFLKDVQINTGTLELTAGANNTHAIFKGSFAGPQGIQVERIGGANIRVVANYSSYGGGIKSSSALRFAVNGNSMSEPAMYIKTNGSIGLGTTSPDEKLTVAGTVKTREVIVEENTGADFVFEEDYQLPNLYELEAFIKINKHLPGIPDAEQMKAEGVKVGELQMKLLQKIEELILINIQQQKELESLHYRINKLKDGK